MKDLNKTSHSNRQTHILDIVLAGVSILAGYFLFFRGYSEIDRLIWDETFHIASAYKYLYGQFFLEPHPPLGKMFIAAGEALLEPNAGFSGDEFWKNDTIARMPNGFDYSGVRFFPVVLSSLCPLLVYLIARVLTKSFLVSLLALGVFSFETALQAQFRAAMLDGMQLFFCLSAVLYYFAFIYERNRRRIFHLCLFGAIVGLAVSVKLNSLFLIVLPLLHSLIQLIKNGFNWAGIISIAKHIMYNIGSIVACCLVLASMYLFHYVLTCKSYKNGMYGTTNYTDVVNSAYLLYKPISILQGNFEFMARYQKGVPELKIGDPKESGSMAVTWPFGYKPISYRWDYIAEDGKPRYAYLYYLPNPVSHWLVALAVLVVFSRFMANVVYGRNEDGVEYILLVLFCGYMVGISLPDRVMYSYHYIPAFSIGVLILVLEFQKVTASVGESVLSRSLSAIVIVGCCAIFWSSVYEITRWTPVSSNEFGRYENIPFFHFEPERYH